MEAKLVKITINTWALFLDEADLDEIIAECGTKDSSSIAFDLSYTLLQQKEEQN